MILIQSHTKLSTVQKEFNDAFPYLRLGFFRQTHAPYTGSLKRDILNPEEELKQVIKSKGRETLCIDADMQVSTLEQLFREKFGIEAQVFRKSGKSWLETTKTDDWTLKRQNDQGMELSYMNK